MPLNELLSSGFLYVSILIIFVLLYRFLQSMRTPKNSDYVSCFVNFMHRGFLFPEQNSIRLHTSDYEVCIDITEFNYNFFLGFLIINHKNKIYVLSVDSRKNLLIFLRKYFPNKFYEKV